LGLALLVACSDAGTEPDGFAIADLAGSWESTAFSVTSQADASLSFDLIGGGGAVNVSIQPSGNFTGTAVIPGVLIGNPEMGVLTVPLAGVMRLMEGDRLRIDFIPEIPPIFTTMDPAFTLSGNSMTIVDDTADFDFDGDGIEEPSVFTGTLTRN
jgi:hypothetical protein